MLTNQPSGTMLLQLQDGQGNSALAGTGGVTIQLASTSGGGTFYDLAGNPLVNHTVVIPAGASSVAFTFKDAIAGTPTITASATGFAPAQQSETVALTANLQVSNTNDSGTGSLRQAILSANAAPGSVIGFAPGVTGVISLLTALPNLSANMTIIGPGANLLTIQRMAGDAFNFGIFSVKAGATVTITGVTIANADSTGVVNSGALTLESVVVANNHGSGSGALLLGAPGGILNTGTLTVLDSTVADNTVTDAEVAAGIDSEGGAVFVIESTVFGNVGSTNTNSTGGIGIYGGSLLLEFSTVTQNVANAPNTSGGGIDSDGNVTIYDSIIAGNTGAAENLSDVNGAFINLGNNLIGSAASQASGFAASDLVGTVANPISAGLAPTLQNNGGTTPTDALVYGSPAIDAGNNTDVPAVDQRGAPRINNGVVDIGAFEYDLPDYSFTSAAQTTFTTGQANTFTVVTTPNRPDTMFATLDVSAATPLPAGVTLQPQSNGTAVLRSLSNALPPESGAFVFNLEDKVSGTLVFTQTFTLNIVTPPAFTSAANATFTVGQPATTSFAIVTTLGLPAKTTITYTGTLPTGVKLTDNGNGTATLSGSPAAGGSTFSFPIIITAATVTANVTQPFTLTVDAAPVITTQPIAQSILAGGTATFTAAATGNPAPTVLWQSEAPGATTFTTITPNVTSTTYTFTPTLAQSGTKYQAVFTNTIGATTHNVATNAVSLTVMDAAPKIVTQPSSQTVAVGSPVTFTAAASGDPAPTVQWYEKARGQTAFAIIQGATSTSYGFVPAQTDNGDQFKAVFTNKIGTITNNVPTNVATLTVDVPPSITTDLPPGQTVTAGRLVSLAVAASGTPTPTVQWQTSIDGVTFTPIKGATALTYTFTPTAAMDGTFIEAIFTNAAGEAISTTDELTVNFAPTITTQPTNQAVAFVSADPNSVTFTAIAGGDPSPTVQWQEKARGAATFTNINTTANPSAATTSLTLTPALIDNGDQFKAVFTNTIGTTTYNAASNVATLSVDVAPFDPSTLPTASTLTAGKSAMFSATASGTLAPAVQWQTSTDGVNFTNINTAAAKMSPYTFTPTAAMDGTYLRAAFTNAVGQAFTNADLLTVNFAPTITTQPTSRTVAVNTAATFTASAAGDPAPTVQWQMKAPGAANFTNITVNGMSTTYVYTPTSQTQSGTQFRAVFTNMFGTTTNNVTTNAATLTVDTVPQIVNQPSGGTVPVGTMVTVTATVTGSPTPSVQWQFSADGGVNYTNIPGATSTSYHFTATASMNGYLARAIFTNPVGQAKSDPATLTVTQAPSITSASSATFTVGQPGSFTVSATGLPTPTLKATGLPAGLSLIDNGNGTATLTGTPFPGTGGVYSTANHDAVTITAHNGSGPDFVQTFTLTVNQPPVIVLSANSATFNVNQSNTFLFNFVASAYPNVTVTQSSGAPLPSTIKVVINKTAGTITLSGTPTVKTDANPYILLFTADNGIFPDAIQEFTLNVS
jgi:hypothetical protein